MFSGSAIIVLFLSDLEYCTAFRQGEDFFQKQESLL
jgi:hypothetical protein